MSTAGFPFDHLVVVHYHWRPGGVRRVVELTLPAIAKAAGADLKKISFLHGGEAIERPNLEQITTPLAFIHEPACDYFSHQSETPERLSRKIHEAVAHLMPRGDCTKTLIWFQNPALARNAMLCRELIRFSRHTGAALVLHHHDFWCAGRWSRWNELRECGCPDLASAAEFLFASGTRCVQVGINWQDFETLQRFFAKQAFHLPNPVGRFPQPDKAGHTTIRDWVADQLKSDAPLWLYPTRFLRRKNLLEAILLTRWLNPEAILATTSGQFSRDEACYAREIKQAAAYHGWRVHFGLLDPAEAPRISELLPVAETVVHTSVQEGFGMTFVETAASGTPLIARAIPSVMPDLAAQGFEFPQVYDDILIDQHLFDKTAERRRQTALAESTRLELPEVFRKLFPNRSDEFNGPVSFSRLTRQAQMEVLAHPAEESWSLCKPLNPKLKHFLDNELRATPWPDETVQTPSRFAEQFLQIASAIPSEPVNSSRGAEHAQLALAQLALGPEAVFPIQLER
ncbi:MAG: glycosyltransferase [bacterium]